MLRLHPQADAQDIPRLHHPLHPLPADPLHRVGEELLASVRLPFPFFLSPAPFLLSFLFFFVIFLWAEDAAVGNIAGLREATVGEDFGLQNTAGLGLEAAN